MCFIFSQGIYTALYEKQSHGRPSEIAWLLAVTPQCVYSVKGGREESGLRHFRSLLAQDLPLLPGCADLATRAANGQPFEGLAWPSPGRSLSQELVPLSGHRGRWTEIHLPLNSHSAP